MDTMARSEQIVLWMIVLGSVAVLALLMIVGLSGAFDVATVAAK